jgi:Kef-type K+ transport system membrane component KefB
LLCAGLAVLLNLSILVVSLVLGATTANLSAHTGRLARVQSRTDPPFYAVFFVIAGAHLQLGLLKTLGLLGVAYILARAVGKLTGTYLGSKLVRAPRMVSARLGPSVLAHAGLAIGLVLSLSRQYPQINAELTAVVLGGILVYEVIGPISVRKMILRAGESHARIPEAMEVLE